MNFGLPPLRRKTKCNVDSFWQRIPIVYHPIGLDYTLRDHHSWAELTPTHFKSLNYLP